MRRSNSYLTLCSPSSRPKAIPVGTGAFVRIGKLDTTGLMMRSYVAMYESGRVLDTSNLITMQVALGADRYGQPWQLRCVLERVPRCAPPFLA